MNIVLQIYRFIEYIQLLFVENRTIALYYLSLKWQDNKKNNYFCKRKP